MSKAAKRPASSRSRSQGKNQQSTVRDPALFRSLGSELCQLMFDFLGEIGHSRKERVEMIATVMKTGKRVKPSRALMSQYFALSDMLNLWRTSKKYTGRDGAPHVLPIYGKGLTLESLARKYLPKTSVEEVVRIICAHGDVQQRRDHKVALMGSNVLIYEKTKEQALASFITKARALASNCLHNLDQPAKARTGYFDRQVTGSLSQRAFQQYTEKLRPQLQNLCDHAEAGLNLPANPNRGKKGDACGVVLFLFREDGPLF